MEIKGRNLVDGLPKNIVVHSEDVPRGPAGVPRSRSPTPSRRPWSGLPLS